MTQQVKDPAGLAGRYAAWDAPDLSDPRDREAAGRRTAQTRALAAEILAAPVGTKLTRRKTVVAGGWSREAGDRADAAAEKGTPAWIEALGPHERVVVTGDGRGADYQQWCEHPDGEHGDWVWYERWTAEGQVAHGFVCSQCRKLTQTG